MTRFRHLLLFAVAFSSFAFGQGAFAPSQTALKAVNGVTSPIANATITICAAAAGGIPCSPALTNTIFQDSALTQSLANPFNSDAFGNYQFAAAAGTYTVTVTAAGFIGNSYQVSIGGAGGGSISIPNPLNAVNLNVSGATNLNGANSSGPVNILPPTLPFIGLNDDPFCAYMVNAGLGQLCNLMDPVTGLSLLAWNDGIGLPNSNQFLLMSDYLPSQQAQGTIPRINAATGALDWSGPAIAPLANQNSVAHSFAFNEGNAQMASGTAVANMIPTATGTSPTVDPAFKSLGDLEFTVSGTGAGTGTAQTFCPTPPITTLAGPFFFNYIPGASAAGGATTLQVCSTTAHSLKKYPSTGTLLDPAANDLITTAVAQIFWDGVEYILLNPATNLGFSIAASGANTSYAIYAANSRSIAADANLTNTSGELAFGGTGATGVNFMQGVFIVTANQAWFLAGTKTNPSIYFLDMSANTGLRSPGATSLSFVASGNDQVFINGTGVAVSSGNAFGWSGTVNDATATKDTCLDRPGNGVVEMDSDSGCSNGLGFHWDGHRLSQDASDFTTTNTTATTWLSFPAFPTKAHKWSYNCEITWQSSVTTAGMVLGISSSVNPTFESGTAVIYNGNGTDASSFKTARNTSTTSGSVTVLTGGNATTATTSYYAHLWGSVEATVTSDTFTIQAWATSASTLTIFRGSFCELY